MTSTLYDQNYHPLAFPLPSSLPPPLFCFSVSCLASQPFCMHALFPLINTAPGVRSDHLIGAPPYVTANNQLCLCPYSSLRHWQPCIPFRLPSTYTRPPYPGATPPSLPPLHHPRAFSLLVPIREPLHHLTTMTVLMPAYTL